MRHTVDRNEYELIDTTTGARTLPKIALISNGIGIAVMDEPSGSDKIVAVYDFEACMLANESDCFVCNGEAGERTTGAKQKGCAHAQNRPRAA